MQSKQAKGRRASRTAIAARRVALGAVAGLAGALYMIGLKYWWFARTPEGFVFYGLFQGDQKIYAAQAGRVLAGSTGFAYAWPWDLSTDAPEIFFQLPIFLLSLLMRLLPDREAHVHFDLLRLVAAPAMFGSLALLVHVLFPVRRWFATVFLLACAGGGLAWLRAIPIFLARETHGFADCLYAVRIAEDNYHGWFLCVFRNIHYTFETMHHFLLYSTVVALLFRRSGIAVLLFGIGLLSGPFVGVQIAAIAIPLLAGDRIESKKPGAMISLIVACLLVAAFLFYYRFFLFRFEVGRTISDYHSRAHPDPLRLADMLTGYGPWLLLFAGSLFNVGFMRRQIRTRAGRLLGLWIVSAFLLTQNGRILDPPVQPMHFTRGNLYLPLLVWSFRFLSHISRAYPILRGSARAKRIAPLLLAAFLLPDNIVYVVSQFAMTPQPGNIIVSEHADEVIQRIRRGKGTVYVHEFDIAKAIAWRTGRATYFGDIYITPHYDERREDMKRLIAGGYHKEFQEKYDVQTFVLYRGQPGVFERFVRALPEEQYFPAVSNPVYLVLERTGAPPR